MKIPIFPMCITPENKKFPLVNWKTQASLCPKQVKEWSTWPKCTHFGFGTGKANDILLLDVDGHEGYETLKTLNLPKTKSQKSKRGCHYLFKYPNNGQVYTNKVKFLKGLDLRGENGLAVYYGFDDAPIADAPEWLLKAATKKQSEINTPVTMSVKLGLKHVERTLDKLSKVEEGERNNKLFISAIECAQFVNSAQLNESFVADKLFNTGIKLGLDKSSVQATLRSGWNTGKINPLTVDFDIPQTETNDLWGCDTITKGDMLNATHLKRPQLFEDWGVRDISLLTGDGGTGKSTLKIYEALCLALGMDCMGFRCIREGKTFYLTGEDSSKKIAAIIGMMLKQMGLENNNAIIKKVLDNFKIKTDLDLCLTEKDESGNITLNNSTYEKMASYFKVFKPDSVILDPISSFWGSESQLNDMGRAVTKFAGRLVSDFNCQVEILNHMGKVSSQAKDISQFSGRGGTALPSHSRVSRVIRTLDKEEYSNLTLDELDDGETAISCILNKFSDGSPHFMEPILLIRKGFLFSRRELKKLNPNEVTKRNSQKIFDILMSHGACNKQYLAGLTGETSSKMDFYLQSLLKDNRINKTGSNYEVVD